MHNYPSRSVSYEGRLEGPVKGQVTFSKYNDRTAGLILLDDGTKYIIDQVASNLFTVSVSNEAAFAQKENHADFIEVSGQTQPNASVTSVCDLGACPGSSTVDIMVVYTPQAESSWGGAANTIANITQAITNMNTSMSNSGINNVSFRLVHTERIGYTESGNFSTDLTRLSGSGDGYMDNIHSLRDQYGADLVSLVIGSPTSSCGIGYLNTNPSAYSAGNAFNVSLYSCVTGNFTLAHENGHNMGLRHDWYVDASTSPCSHHHGYVNEVALAQGTSSAASSRWRTIMAYNDRCSVAGFNCTRINMWSNPNISYNGDAAGSAIGSGEPSDEAYAFHRMACLVAAFRPEAGGGGGGGGTCSAPSGLSTINITTSSATATWAPVNGANSYDVDYKASSSGSWINIAAGTTSTSWNLAGMAASTSYDWRVRANCSSGSSSYTQSQFSTQALTSCNVPSGVSTINITSSSATATWNSVSGANSYSVDYKASSSGTWINIASGTTSTSWGLAGMSPSTSYDWRVRANCSSGASNYAQTQFSTQALTSCNVPSGVSTINISTSSATATWNSVSGATSYNVDYKASSSGSWINIAFGITSTSWGLAGMSPATSYDWRVRANCASGSSSYAQTQFSTQSLTSCNVPSGANTINITATSATATWNPVSGANSYDVEYKASSSGSWITIAYGTTSTTWGLAAMSPSTTYDWRVRANCSSGVSNYTQSQFTTQGLSSCNAPTGVSTLNITTSSAIATWNAVSGANSYNVDYKASSSGQWINIASGITSTSWNLYGMSSSTTYDWRVRANCSSGNSNYTETQFSTLSLSETTCNAPGELFTSNITASTATVNWSAVNGAFSYTVEYKPAFTGSWITAASATYSTSVNLYSLSGTTTYDWRVKANCTLTESSVYTTAQFSTSGSTPPPALPGCPGPYDVSTNGTISGAANIPLNTDIMGTVSPRNDIDHYRFAISSGGSVTVSLIVPSNYNLEVLNSSGGQMASSQNNGTQSESISLNLSAGTYYAKVFPKGNAYSAASCYTLKVQTGTAFDFIVKNDFSINLFPNPTEGQLNVWIEGMNNKRQIRVYDILGKLVMQHLAVNTLTQLNVSKLPAGVYMLNVNDGKQSKAAKFVKK